MRKVLVKLAHVISHPLLIAFDGEEVIAPLFLHHDAGGFRLGMHGIGGDQRTVQIEPAQ